VFDGEEDEIAFSAINPGGFLNTVRELIGEKAEVPPAVAPLPAFADTGLSLLDPTLAMFETLADWLASDVVQKGLSEEQRVRVRRVVERLK
jgi:hypothetical protein